MISLNKYFVHGIVYAVCLIGVLALANLAADGIIDLVDDAGTFWTVCLGS